MNTATVAIAVISLLVGKTSTLVALRLRLRERVQQQKAQREYLAGLAAAVPSGCQLELDDRLTEGQRLMMRVTWNPAAHEERAR